MEVGLIQRHVVVSPWAKISQLTTSQGVIKNSRYDRFGRSAFDLDALHSADIICPSMTHWTFKGRIVDPSEGGYAMENTPDQVCTTHTSSEMHCGESCSKYEKNLAACKAECTDFVGSDNDSICNAIEWNPNGRCITYVGCVFGDPSETAPVGRYTKPSTAFYRRDSWTVPTVDQSEYTMLTSEVYQNTFLPGEAIDQGWP